MSSICPANRTKRPRRAPSAARTTLKSLMFALPALFLAAAPASADDDAPVKRGGFQLAVGAVDAIAVSVSQDRSEGEILSQPITLQMHGKIDFKRRNGFVERAGLFAGHCKRTDCGPTHTLLWFRDQKVSQSSDGGGLPENDWNFNIPVTTTPERLLAPLEQNELIQTCKQNPQAEFVHWTTITLSANTRTDDPSIGVDFEGVEESPDSLDDIDFNGGDQSRHADFAVLVSCSLSSESESPTVPGTPSGLDVGFDHGPMKVNDIRMTLTTYSDAYTEPTPGTQCKMAKLRVTMETNQEGLASFKLWKQRGGGGVENEDVIVGAHHEDGRFLAVHERWISVDETTRVQFNARDLVNETFNHETGWEDITLHCAGAGGGGLQTPTADNDDNAPDMAAFEGNFQYIDNGPQAAQNACPRNARAMIWFDSPSQSNIHYSLDCGALGNHSGVLQPEKIANGHYRAGTLATLELTETIEAGCTLRTVSPGTPRDHAFSARTFGCARAAGHSDDIGDLTGTQPDPVGDIPLPRPRPEVNPAVGATVSGLTAEPKPTHQPENPSDDAAIMPSVCIGGAIRYGACVCPGNVRPKKISRFEYLCERGRIAIPTLPETMDPARTNPPTRVPQIVCTGGTVSNGKCQCGRNKLLRKTGNRQFQCIAVAQPPKPKKPLLVAPVKPSQARLVCRGGKVAGGTCRCGPNAKRLKIGPNAFACQKKIVRTNPQPKAQILRVNPQVKKKVLRANPAPKKRVLRLQRVNPRLKN